MIFTIFPRRDWLGRKRWHWHAQAANGEIVAQGEAYHNRQDAQATVALIRTEAAAANVYLER